CYAESKAGHSKAVIELKEHHRLTTTIHTSTVPEVLDSKQYRITLTPTTTITTTTTTTTTIRAQLLKRNKISDQTSNITKVNSAASSTLFISYYLSLLIMFSLYL
ncbi:unnamed protein product, partial [Rotaria magnacalcarata]